MGVFSKITGLVTGAAGFASGVGTVLSVGAGVASVVGGGDKPPNEYTLSPGFGKDALAQAIKNIKAGPLLNSGAMKAAHQASKQVLEEHQMLNPEYAKMIGYDTGGRAIMKAEWELIKSGKPSAVTQASAAAPLNAVAGSADSAGQTLLLLAGAAVLLYLIVRR